MTETPQPQQAYISKVHLKGYKSIRDLEIDFKPGLNIIIGPNGSGKTNFLEGLIDLALIPKFKDKSFISVEFYFGNNNIILWSIEIIKVNQIDFSFVEKLSIGKSTVSRNGNLLRNFDDVFESYTFLKEYLKQDFYKIFLPVKIDFGIIQNVSFLDSSSNFKINFNNKTVDGRYWQSPFEKNIFNDFDFSKNKFEKFNDKQFIKELSIKPILIEKLKKFTPIVDLKIKQPFLFNKLDSIKEVNIDNLFFDFKINNSWHPWKELSDGTKRLFNIVTQILSRKCLILIEEPELGIHPDQLYKLMDFLKEQSKEKQIIITTHSPDVLNILGADELDRIIVTKNDNEKGTIMRKLQLPQIEKARRYMESAGLFLSDYWVHSDLEAAAYETEEED